LKMTAVSVAYLSHARFRNLDSRFVIDCRSWLVAG
jgi:hypothetical protein